MPSKGSPKELERPRLKAVMAVLNGEGQVDVARIFPIHKSTLCEWVAR